MEGREAWVSLFSETIPAVSVGKLARNGRAWCSWDWSPRPSQPPVLTEVSSLGICSSRGTSGAPAPGLLSPVDGEGLLPRTSSKCPNHGTHNWNAGQTRPELGARVGDTGDSQMEAKGPGYW